MSRFGKDDLSETLQDLLTGCAKTLMWLGAAASALAIAGLIYTCTRVGSTDAANQMADALRNIGIFQKALVVGVVGLSIGLTYLFWGEELVGAGQLILALALYFAPLYLPSIIGDTNNKAASGAFQAFQTGGILLGVLALAVIATDVTMRVKTRAKTGARADHLKYGKGIKEEKDRQNVLLGKCWQLPFCRKFVRDMCPIYHAKRTCWKELVGCMCEESVIRNAMENKTIPKDAILAAKFIPQNHRLSAAQKKERCYSCVIYNEHQRHKYKVGWPLIVGSFLLIYFMLHGVLIEAVTAILVKINHIVNGYTLGGVSYQPPQFFVEAMLGFFMFIGLTYAMKILEFAVFKIKV